jgi:hypothetical protein
MDQWYQSGLLLIILMHVPMRLEYKELGLELVSLEERSSCMPK